MSRSRVPLAWPFPIALALRYLRSARRDAFITFLSAVAAGGLALGVAALILALGAVAGFHDLLLTEMRSRTPDLEVSLPEEGYDPASLKAQVEAQRGVAFSQWLTEGRGWLLSSGRIRPVRVTGFEERLPASFPGGSTPVASQPGEREPDRNEPEGSAPGAQRREAEGLYVSERLAAYWGLERGQSVELASNLPTLTPFGPQPRSRRVVVAGTFEPGRTEEEERVALPLDIAASLFAPPRLRLEVAAARGVQPEALAARLERVLPPGARVTTWRELNRALLFALRLEKSLMFVSVSLIVLVAALALIADLALIVSNKRPELGMLATAGATPAQLRGAFLWLGGLLAGAAATFGAVAGTAAAYWLDRGEILPLRGEVYFIHYVPFAVRSGEVLQVLALTAALAMGGAWFVARRAAALDPVEALRR